MALFSKDRILVPIDFSDDAFNALEETLAFTGDAAAVHVIYVLASLEPTEPGMIWNTIDSDKRKKNVQSAF
ncbi:MAG: universal stress protein, partial [Cyanobacteria bacterium J06627_15]